MEYSGIPTRLRLEGGAGSRPDRVALAQLSVGTLLVWDGSSPVQARSASDAQSPDLWVVDGQQRTTGLCILSGRKPYWWSVTSDWEQTRQKFDIRFDVHTKEPPFFVVANAATRRVRGSRYMPVSKLFNLDTSRDPDLKAL
jgi:hypothetical protein